MNNDIQKLLAAPGLEATAFPPNSRYHGIGMKAVKTEAGETIVHLKRRFVPPPENFTLLQLHTVVQGDRLDNLTYKYLGDAEQFWQVCDANSAVRPEELTETIGRRLRITLPDGIPGVSNA